MKAVDQIARRLLILGGHVKQVNYAQLSTSSPQIELSTTKCLVDEKVKIRILGLSKGQRVTLQAYMKESNKSYGACGHYVADYNGSVDTFRDSSYGGTYQGVEPMGLFWSMKTTPGVKPGRLVKADVMVPFDVTLAVQNGFCAFEDLPWTDNLMGLASCHLYRSYVAPGVKRISVKENGVYGTLFLPPGDGPFPAVYDIMGITGGIMEMRSALLASHGFASYIVPYVDFEDLPKDQTILDLNYFLKTFDWLASHPQVDPNAIGGVSTCVGGGFLQLIASLRPAMKCIASVSSTGIPPGPEQTVEGHHIMPLWFRPERYIFIDGMLSFLDTFLPGDDVTVCPGWRYGAKLLSIQGLDDKCINPSYLEVFKAHIPEEFRRNCTFITYPGAGHLIEPPYTPMSSPSFNQIAKVYLVFGGHPILHARAQEDSWARILAFLDQNLRKSQQSSPSLQI